MFKLTSKITVESNKEGDNKRYVIPNFVNNIQINSSWDNLTDTCSFELPKKVNWEGVERLVNDGFSDEPALFERGDKITIELGYDDENYQMFEGFISDIEPNSPVKINCKDMMWYLGQMKLDAIYTSIIEKVPPQIRNIGALLTPLLAIVNSTFKLRGLKSEFEFSLLNEDGLPATGNLVSVGTFRYPSGDTNTVAGLLEALKKKYDIYFYFRNNVLQVDVGGRLKASGNVVARIGADLVEGLRAEAFANQKVVWPFHFQRNVIDQNLEYINEKRIPLKIEVSSSPEVTKPDNKLDQALADISGAVNDLPDGFLESVQVQFSNLSSDEEDAASTMQRVNISDLNRAALLSLAQRIYNNVRYTGFSGSFTTFGQYPTKHGDVALLTDTRNPERNGAFLIREVNTTFGVGGYRQQVSLERNVTKSILN